MQVMQADREPITRIHPRSGRSLGLYFICVGKFRRGGEIADSADTGSAAGDYRIDDIVMNDEPVGCPAAL
jgi:hypothetical protein